MSKKINHSPMVRDLGKKAADDVCAAIWRTVALVDHPEEKTCIAFSALAPAIGIVVGLLSVSLDLSRDEAATGLRWILSELGAGRDPSDFLGGDE